VVVDMFIRCHESMTIFVVRPNDASGKPMTWGLLGVDFGYWANHVCKNQLCAIVNDKDLGRCNDVEYIIAKLAT
jgi:hypothetical protein